MFTDASPQTLPPGWERCVTPAGQVYFAHRESRRTQWQPPVVVPEQHDNRGQPYVKSPQKSAEFNLSPNFQVLPHDYKRRFFKILDIEAVHSNQTTSYKIDQNSPYAAFIAAINYHNLMEMHEQRNKHRPQQLRDMFTALLNEDEQESDAFHTTPVSSIESVDTPKSQPKLTPETTARSSSLSTSSSSLSTPETNPKSEAESATASTRVIEYATLTQLRIQTSSHSVVTVSDNSVTQRVVFELLASKRVIAFKRKDIGITAELSGWGKYVLRDKNRNLEGVVSPKRWRLAQFKLGDIELDINKLVKSSKVEISISDKKTGREVGFTKTKISAANGIHRILHVDQVALQACFKAPSIDFSKDDPTDAARWRVTMLITILLVADEMFVS